MKQNFTVRQGALDGVESFLAVARRRSFRKAAADLGVTPSAMSQTIRGLEAAIGVALFARTTRTVGLTEAGERFHARAAPAYAELLLARDAARGLGERPSGLLRLSVPRAVLPLLLQPVIASFCRAWPEVELEVAASEERVDLVRSGFDAGVRMGHLIDADMVAVRLSPPFRLVVVGSPRYFAARGRPRRLEDLRGHACLRLRRSDGTLAPWRFGRLEATVSGPFIANDFPMLLDAALEGVGLTQMPEPVAAEEVAARRLEVVLAAHAFAVPGVFLYHPGRAQVLPKLRAFIEHVKDGPLLRGFKTGTRAPGRG